MEHVVKAFENPFKSEEEKSQQRREFEERAEYDRNLVESMLPGGNLRPLFESETCLLCRNDPPLKRGYYAVTNMGNVEPKGTKVSAIGLKVKTRIGSIVPLQIACCPQCKRNHMIASMMNVVIMIAMLGISLLVLAIPQVYSTLNRIHEATSLIAFVVMIPLSYVVGKVCTRVFIKNAAKVTVFDISEIPFVKQMVDRGWFPLNLNGNKVASLIFSKTRLTTGWFID